MNSQTTLKKENKIPYHITIPLLIVLGPLLFISIFVHELSHVILIKVVEPHAQIVGIEFFKNFNPFDLGCILAQVKIDGYLILPMIIHESFAYSIQLLFIVSILMIVYFWLRKSDDTKGK